MNIIDTQTTIQTREDNTDVSIIKEAAERAQESYNYYKDTYKRAENDVDFLYREQQNDVEIDEDNRLHILFNRLPQFVNKIIGKQKKEVQTIHVIPTEVGVEATMVSDSGVKAPVWDIVSDIVRDIEYRSNAVSQYKIAFKHAVEGGFGWLRVLTKYKKNSFDLDISIRAIRDRWSVLPDPKTQEPDMSDMRYCFITQKISRKEFKKLYPNASMDTIIPGETSLFWGDESTITVVEYFRREPYQKKLLLLSNGQTINANTVDIRLLRAQGISILKERITTDYKVVWTKLTAQDVLESDIEFPTSTIPIVPILGRIVDKKKKKTFYGLIHDAKGAQIALDKMMSSSLERIDDAPLSPWIVSDKSIEGYEDIWADSNTKKYSVLPYREGKQPPNRLAGAQVPVAELNLIQELDASIKNSTGIFDASLGKRSNETSGVAIRARQEEGDTGTFEFIDNYRMAIRRIGLLLVELIPKIYDTERKIVLRKVDDTTDYITVNKPSKDPITGEIKIINKFVDLPMDVRIISDVSYATKREQNADQILALMRVNPQVAQIGSDLLVRNLDFSDSSVLADRLEKTIPLQYLSKQKQEEIKKDMPPPQPSPEEIKSNAEIQKSQLALEIEKIKLQETQLALEAEKLQISNQLSKADQQRKQKIAQMATANITTPQRGNEGV